ncbi:MAG: PQQ-dependent sugar dehydrogenase [Pirellulales bacterium]
MDRIINVPPQSTLGITTQVLFPGDGSNRIILPELRGRVRMLENGIYTTFLDLSSEVIQSGAQGLLGTALHPGYADPDSLGYRKLYTFHSTSDTAPTPDFINPGPASTYHNVVTEWQASAADPKVVDLSTRREIFRATHPNELHSGGMVTFGPDGHLYTTIGTPAGYELNAQDNSNLLGTIIRIDPLDPSLTPGSANPVSANGKYRIPSDNPFLSDPALDEIFAYGVRNPYRFSVDPVSGLVFAGDVGQGAREEVSAFGAGANLGWPYREGTLPYITPPIPAPTMLGPIAEYSHADGRSVIGGFVYHGSIPELQGKYIFGEFSFGTGPFSSSRGRLLWIDPFDEQGELKDFSEIEINEFAFGPETCALMGTCKFDMTLYGFGVDEDQELYVIGTSPNRPKMYKLASAFVAPDGDYDRDGTVDIEDYNVWRDSVGATVGLRPADGNDGGVIDQLDYFVWKQNFGVTLGSGTSNVVPEPSGFVGAVILASMLWTNLMIRRKHVSLPPT